MTESQIKLKREQNREFMRKDYQKNIEKYRKRSREWRKNHPEKKREWDKRYAKRNAGKIAERYKKWAQQNREHLRVYVKKWIRLTVHRGHLLHRARKAKATIADCKPRIRLLKWREKFCHWCCTHLTDQNFSIDHVIPLSRGGAHHPDNLVAACKSCNSKKHDKLVEEWTWELAA